MFRSVMCSILLFTLPSLLYLHYSSLSCNCQHDNAVFLQVSYPHRQNFNFTDEVYYKSLFKQSIVIVQSAKKALYILYCAVYRRLPRFIVILSLFIFIESNGFSLS